MNSLISYLYTKSEQVGHKLNMSELREAIKQDSLEHERIKENLKDLYSKTYQYEKVEEVLKELY